MEKEFIPYELALRMKELGFDEECIAYYQKSAVIGNDNILPISFTNMASDFNDYEYSKLGVPFYSAPTRQQAFRWFREEYTTKGWVTPIVNVDGFSDIHEARIHQEESSVLVLGNYDSYEEAELACLEKLIKIVEQTNAEMTDHSVYK
jgi:hypothetical protein